MRPGALKGVRNPDVIEGFWGGSPRRGDIDAGKIIRGLAVAAMACLASGAALAAGETFKVVSVNTLGCNAGNFAVTVERANLDGGTYTVRTVVTVGALVYMNENATISVSGLSGWNVFNNFTYGPVPNPGTYPIPSGQQMRLDFTLERPVGSTLYAWTLVVDGCDTGNILFNGPTVGRSASPVPTLTEWATIGLMGLILLSGVVRLRSRRR